MAGERRIYITVRDKGRLVRADYTPYGPYIELTFGSFAYKPTEVINVWDYENDVSELQVEGGGDGLEFSMRRAVKEWIKTQDEEWPEWYEDYLEDAGF